MKSLIVSLYQCVHNDRLGAENGDNNKFFTANADNPSVQML